ncbi:MAG: hypothetical protein AAGA48_17480 [Myxococcota bacterium]
MGWLIGLGFMACGRQGHRGGKEVIRLAQPSPAAVLISRTLRLPMIGFLVACTSSLPPSTETGREGDIAAPLPSTPPITTGPTGTTGSIDTGTPLPAATAVTVSGRTIEVNGTPFLVRGVCWNPVARGDVHPADLDFAGFVNLDAPLMAKAGLNVVRTYEPITDRAVLDTLYANRIYVMNTVYPNGFAPVESVDGLVAAVQDHPAVLGWVVGNEWNYNGIYSSLSFEEARDRVEAVAARLQTLDDKPVITIYGELPPSDVLSAIPSVDIWGINAYRGIGFGSLFTDWAAISTKPMFLGEYGADAWDATQNQENEAAQAEATAALTGLILAQSTLSGGVVSGGTIFEWADEWWKDVNGDPAVHDTGGIAPGGGPHPDATFNEEWWGIVDIDRNPRSAYFELQKLYAP